MSDKSTHRYWPHEDASPSVAVVSPVSEAHQEDVLEQDWGISTDSNPDALDEVSQAEYRSMTLRFEADTSTVAIDADDRGNPIIEVESHR